MHKNLSRYWLLTGATALAVAGLFSLVLVVARTPQLAALPGFKDLFHQALVVHVDLSVLVWFLAIACMLWSLTASASRQVFPFLEEAALICFALGTLALTLSPLFPGALPLMSNYIPVLMTPVFFMGLSLLACGTMLMVARLLLARQWLPQFSMPLRYAIFSGAMIAVMALAAFVWSYWQMPPEIDGQQYYELLFWGGGHVLQFLHTQMLMACWLLMAAALLPAFGVNRILLKSLLSVGPAVALVTPMAYLLYDVTSMEHRQFFTHGMIVAGGIAPCILGLIMLPPLVRAKRNALWSTLLASISLFIYGGILGGLIEGQNVVIPAHYHGSIVGVTLAFMGIGYYYLPQFGYRDVSGWRLAFWQPVVYALGQVMHISGLAWSGGYGVLRKTPGALEEGFTAAKAAMGFMGAGGLLAIIGGFMFVIVIARAVWKKAGA